MKLIPFIAAAVSIFSASPAFSALVTVDFEGATSFAAVDNYYNGGAGPNFGISFSPSALALSNDGLGAGPGGTYYSGAPTNGTVFFAPDVAATANVNSGFVGSVEFYYSSKTNLTTPTTVSVFDGFNGTGILLGSVTLAPNADADVVFDTWSLASVNFVGAGRSIVFGDNGGFIAYDNVTVNAVPLPAALLLFPFGAAALGAAGRRKKVA